MNTFFTAIIYNDKKMVSDIIKCNKRCLTITDLTNARLTAENMNRRGLVELFDHFIQHF